MELLETEDSVLLSEIIPLIEIGLLYEQQLQELLLTDIKYNFYQNPLKPVYFATADETSKSAELMFRLFEGGLIEVGHSSNSFAIDNESTRHKVWLEPFKIASRPVTNSEYLAFMSDGGYKKAQYWLSDGCTWQLMNLMPYTVMSRSGQVAPTLLTQ